MVGIAAPSDLPLGYLDNLTSKIGTVGILSLPTNNAENDCAEMLPDPTAVTQRRKWSVSRRQWIQQDESTRNQTETLASSCVTLGKFINFSELWYPPL